MSLTYNILVNCRFCSFQYNTSSLADNLNECRNCSRSDVDIFVYFKSDKEVVLKDCNDFMNNLNSHKPVQHKIGTFYKFICANCSNEGYIHKDQNFCPVCLKRTIRKTNDINAAYNMNMEIWIRTKDFLNPIISKNNMEKINKYIKEEIPIYKTCEDIVTRIQTYKVGDTKQTTKWIGLPMEELEGIENDPIIEELE